MTQSRPTPTPTINAPVHIETNGYLMRSLLPQDVTLDFIRWLNASDMMQGLNLTNVQFNEQSLAQFISSFDNLHNYFIGIFNASNKLVGFYTVDVNLMHKTGNITTGVDTENNKGKPVLWATIDALLDHFYLYRGLEKIIARILARNFRMLFCFIGNERFVCEAILKKECIAPSGARVDIMLFSSFKEGHG